MKIRMCMCMCTIVGISTYMYRHTDTYSIMYVEAFTARVYSTWCAHVYVCIHVCTILRMSTNASHGVMLARKIGQLLNSGGTVNEDNLSDNSKGEAVEASRDEKPLLALQEFSKDKTEGTVSCSP